MTEFFHTFVCLHLETWFHVAQAGLEFITVNDLDLLIVQHLPPKNWDYRVVFFLKKKTKQNKT